MCVWCVIGSRVGDAHGRASKPALFMFINKDTYSLRMKNWFLEWLMSFLIAQQHVGDPAADGEQTSRLWALQAALIQ